MTPKAPRTPSKGGRTIRDRVKSLRRIRAADLHPHPQNWRRHPDSQREVLRELIAEVGFAGTVLAYDDPEWGLTIIDGHLRQDTVGADDEVLTIVLDVSREEAKTILATFDPVSGLADLAGQQLEELLAEISPSSEALGDFLATLGQDAAAQIAQDAHMISADGGMWNPVDDGTSERAVDVTGYDMGSVWYDFDDEHCRMKAHALPLPPNPAKRASGRLFGNYSRSPLQETERIVRTYMRPGDRFIEFCAGWYTFSATAAL